MYNIIGEDKPPLHEFVHFGVKGMRWGVRKKNGSKTTSLLTQTDKKRLAKRAAVATGVMVSIIGAAYLAKHNGVSIDKINQSKRSKDAADRALEKVASDSIVHATRTKHRGFTFMKHGETEGDQLREYEKAFGSNRFEPGVVRLSDGRVAASFNDPSGKTDASGRPIPHQIIIPRSMSRDIHDLTDVENLIWPSLKDIYDSHYEDPRE